MEINKEDEEKIVNFGAFNYTSKKMANILGVEESEIIDLMNDETSIFCKLIQKGRDMADYFIDVRLFELSRNGDIKALSAFNSRTKRTWGGL